MKDHFSILARKEHMVKVISHLTENLKLKQSDASLLQIPASISLDGVYGGDGMQAAVKLVTLAPELEGSSEMIKTLTERGVKVSLGHSASDYDTGLKALQAGAGALTHVFNAMNPLDHRQPSLPGLISSPESPFYSIIPDGIHLHSATVAMAFRANPRKTMLITDSIEVAGLPDGIYPGHAQIPHQQQKMGNKVTIAETDILIGSCIDMDECVRNLAAFSRCSLAESIRCATENVAEFMGLRDRGVLETGKRADIVALNKSGHVQQTWIGGKRIYDASTAK